MGVPRFFHFRHGGFDDFRHHPRFHHPRHDRRGRIGTHAAGVRTRIAIADALVILRRCHGECMLAIDKGKEARLLALHAFLDHQLGTGLAKPATEHHVDGRMRFRDSGGDDDALAGGKPVRLHHNRRAP